MNTQTPFQVALQAEWDAIMVHIDVLEDTCEWMSKSGDPEFTHTRTLLKYWESRAATFVVLEGKYLWPDTHS